jgi:hypothetical protein
VGFLDVILGISAQGTQTEQEEEGGKAEDEGSEETKWTHGWVCIWTAVGA